MSRIEGFSAGSGEQLAASSEHTRRTRDQRSLMVFAMSAFAIGSNTSIALHHWAAISAIQARGLGVVAGVVGGLVVVRIAGRLLPRIFRATHLERR
jgi:hypothetical protein